MLFRSQAMNGEIFVAWLVQFLIPTLIAGDIVVMDKALLRKAAERTVAGLWAKIGELLAEFSEGAR